MENPICLESFDNYYKLSDLVKAIQIFIVNNGYILVNISHSSREYGKYTNSSTIYNAIVMYRTH